MHNHDLELVGDISMDAVVYENPQVMRPLVNFPSLVVVSYTLAFFRPSLT